MPYIASCNKWKTVACIGCVWDSPIAIAVQLLYNRLYIYNLAIKNHYPGGHGKPMRIGLVVVELPLVR
ncbi:MAG: hypothetical protein NQ127_01755 [Candidatus Cardinium sp.]|nr:hypothetical protein [Candidatus Cardinium sp.]